MDFGMEEECGDEMKNYKHCVYDILYSAILHFL